MNKTNDQMIKEFGDFQPRNPGVLEVDEVVQIRKQFCIADRTDLELQNLRDDVLMFFSNYHLRYPNDVLSLNTMTAIVGVIDDEKERRGMEV